MQRPRTTSPRSLVTRATSQSGKLSRLAQVLVRSPLDTDCRLGPDSDAFLHWLAGFFLATIITHHLMPKPLALLANSGIPTFRHPFFNSSVLITPEPLSENELEQLLAEPVSIGTCPPSVFDQHGAPIRSKEFPL